MAFLLLLHEKMRLKRKVNTMTLRQAKLANRKSRIADKITKMQKMFSKQTAMLEKQASIWTKQFSMAGYASIGMLGNGAWNPMSTLNGGGINPAYTQKALLEYFTNGDGAGKLSEDQVKDLLINGGKYTVKDGKVQVRGEDGKYTDDSTYTPEILEAFKNGTQAVQWAQSQQQYAIQQQCQMFESNVSIWVEAQKQALEEQQEEMLLPLEVEQEEIEMETAGLETQLQDARSRLEALEQACSQEIKDSVPKFGLG